jgi:hypothetical protein
MGIRFTSVLRLMAIATPIVFIGSFANVANAQRATTQESAAEVQTLPEAFEDAYYRFDENFYRNRQVPRSLTWFTGPFPENEIAGDGRVVNRLYQDALAQQTTSDPTIRVQDADNPYQSSIMTAPIVPDEEPIPAAFYSPFSRSPVNASSGSPSYGGGGRRGAVPALW